MKLKRVVVVRCSLRVCVCSLVCVFMTMTSIDVLKYSFFFSVAKQFC